MKYGLGMSLARDVPRPYFDLETEHRENIHPKILVYFVKKQRYSQNLFPGTDFVPASMVCLRCGQEHSTFGSTFFSQTLYLQCINVERLWHGGRVFYSTGWAVSKKWSASQH